MLSTYNTVAAGALLEWDRAGVIGGGFDVVGRAPKSERELDWPYNAPYNGDMELFMWFQYMTNTVDVVPLSQSKQFPSSPIFHPLTKFDFSVAVGGLFGCAFLLVMSTKGGRGNLDSGNLYIYIS